MSDHIYEYKGYLGSAEVDTENGVLVGRLLFIRDPIGYSSVDVPGLRQAFEEAVDEYLGSFEGSASEPDRPCKGSFNVRTAPDLHRQVAVQARIRGQSLNEFVVAALTFAVGGSSKQVEHVHTVRVSVAMASTDEQHEGPVFLASGESSHHGGVRGNTH